MIPAKVDIDYINKEIAQIIQQHLRDRKAIPRQSMAILASFGNTWVQKIEKAHKAERAVYQELKKLGYIVVPLEHIRQEVISLHEKLAAKQNLKLPDAMAIKTKNLDPTESFFLDVKYKNSKDYLGWINQDAYLDYWEICRWIIQKLKIFFYLDDTQEIFSHICRDPQKEPHFEEDIKGLNPIYKIPLEELTRQF